jgi:hypothetical protein
MISDYDRVSDLGEKKNYALYASTLITILLTVLEKYKVVESYPSLKDYISVIIAINLILVLLFVYFGLRQNYIFSRAERNRRLEYIDNSFDTNFGGKRVVNYFTQDKLQYGFYKLCVNCFENVFHTFSIVREMQAGVFLKAFIIAIFFVFSAAVGDKGIIRSIIEAILPLAIIQDAIKIAIFSNRLETTLSNFKSFFSSIKDKPFLDKEPEALKNVIEYETTIAWASIPLDSDVFYKNQDILAKEWDELKKQYKIDKANEH